MSGKTWAVRIRGHVTEAEWWEDGYDVGHAHGSAGIPNILDVLGRRGADVIPLRRHAPSAEPAMGTTAL